MKTLATLPPDMSMVDYFKEMNIFEKRQLLNELEEIKLSMDTRLVSFKKSMALAALLSLVGIISLPYIWSVVYFGAINLIFYLLYLKYSKKSINYRALINYLTKRL